MRVAVKDIYQAYKKCHQGKAKSTQAQIYSARLIDNIFATCLALQTNSYTPKPYSCFVATNGVKPREIHAADFSDRVLHHYIVPKLEKIISHKFIYHSCANQLNKGTHFGVNQLQKMLRQHSGSQAHYLQLDIHNFFYSIDKKILLSILAKHIKCSIKKRQITLQQGRDYYFLCKTIITTVVQKNNLSQTSLKGVPLHKQLRYKKAGKALPIGNLSSQFFGNMYMHELDIFIKHQLKVKHYVRFVDDFVLLGEAVELQAWQSSIEIFLRNTLKIKLKAEKILRPIEGGVDFLGYIIYPHYKLVRKRVVNNFYQKLKAWQQCSIEDGKMQLNRHSCAQIQALVASYSGHFQHAKSAKIMQTKWQQFPWLRLLFSLQKDKYQFHLYNRFAQKFAHQCYYFIHYFKNFVVLIQKGTFFNVLTQHSLKLPAHLARHFNSTKAAHLRFLTTLLHYYQKNAIAYIFVSEQGYAHNRLKQRKLRLLFHPQLRNLL